MPSESKRKSKTVTAENSENKENTCKKNPWPWKHAKWQKPDTKGLHVVWLHLHEVPRTDKSIETESRWVVAMCWVERGWWVPGKRCGVSFWGDENVLEPGSGDD